MIWFYFAIKTYKLFSYFNPIESYLNILPAILRFFKFDSKEIDWGKESNLQLEQSKYLKFIKLPISSGRELRLVYYIWIEFSCCRFPIGDGIASILQFLIERDYRFVIFFIESGIVNKLLHSQEPICLIFIFPKHSGKEVNSVHSLMNNPRSKMSYPI